MKNIISLILFTFVTSVAYAHEIEGTLVLKGAIKTKIMLSGEKTICKVKIDKVKNLMKEDSFGNPAYLVLASVKLEGHPKIKVDRDYKFSNLFATQKGSEVRDFEYEAAPDAFMKIDREGRVLFVSFKLNTTPITCSF